jgi:hypothetical protein
MTFWCIPLLVALSLHVEFIAIGVDLWLISVDVSNVAPEIYSSE